MSVRLDLRSVSNRGQPRRSSICLSVIESAEGVRYSFSDASLILPWSATSTKARSASNRIMFSFP
jgi:hypothetical protein